MTEISHRNFGIWDVRKKSEFWKVFAERTHADFIEKMLFKFSRNKISSNNGEFDKNYISKTVDNYKIKSVLNNRNITELILRQNITFIGGEQDKQGNFNLSLNIHRNVNCIEQLETIYNLAKMLIDSLNGRKPEVNKN